MTVHQIQSNHLTKVANFQIFELSPKFVLNFKKSHSSPLQKLLAKYLEKFDQNVRRLADFQNQAFSSNPHILAR